MKTSLIVARGIEGVIGVDGKLPWKCPAELFQFKSLTMNKIVAMGRKTWDSLPIKPLPGRVNIVITSDVSTVVGADAAVNSVERAIEAAELFKHKADELVFIGGSSIYNQVVNYIDEAHVTEMDCFGNYTNITDPGVTCFNFWFKEPEFNLIKKEIVLEAGTGEELFHYYHWVRNT